MYDRAKTIISGMLFFKVYGYKEVPISVDQLFIRCPSCETHNWADVMIISKYFHLYFIPMWPVAREVNVICESCGLKRNNIVFSEKLVDNFQEVKSRYPHPWLSYIGLICIVVFVLIVIIAQAIHSMR